MKLTDIKGEQALDVLADLIEPMTQIASDKAIQAAVKAKVRKAEIIKMILKGHKKAIIEIMAILEGKDPAEYEFNLFTLPAKLLDIANDPNVEALFGLQAQTGDATSSAPASESTEAN